MASDHPDAHLYGIPRPRHQPKSTIKSSTSQSFASSLSSLIATQGSKSTATSRSRNGRSLKDDIFTTHNKGSRKRAAADLTDENYISATGNKHRSDVGGVDYDILHRSKRKLEEKARLYAAMKRGDYAPPSRGVNPEDSGPLVDFDRKWAESEATGKDNDESDSDFSVDSEDEMVEYVDEFGRTRTGTKAEANRELQRQRIASNAEVELAEMSARPSMPEGIIVGDTIQSAAFNPDAAIEKAMEDLAAKRDRSATPPEETHYDATKEIRSKGVGFYQFSKDSESRKKEFENLENERQETVRLELEREDRRRKKMQELEARKKKIQEHRSQKQADGFLRSLQGELDEPV